MRSPMCIQTTLWVPALLLLQHATWAAGVQTQVGNEEAQVRAEVFDQYDPKIRPVVDATDPVDVQLGLAFTNLLDLDLVTGVATVAIWLRASWYDPKLDWNASAHGGVWQFTAGVEEVWTPDFLAMNHVERFEKEIRHEDTKLYVYSDAWGVYWSRPAVVRLSYNVDARLFPFDTQECPIILSSWSNSGLLQNLSVMAYTAFEPSSSEGTLRVTDGKIDMANFGGSAEFAVTTKPALREISYYACCPSEPWPKITFYLTMERKSSFYVKTMIIPNVITAALSFSTFALPHQCGERLGLGITCMLVISAIMLISSDFIPITEESTVMGTLFSGCFTYSLLALLVTVLTSFLMGQIEDGDDDGRKGTWFVTKILGISPFKATQGAFLIDTVCGILLPVTFACFITVTLSPTLSTGAHVGLSVLIIFGSGGLACLTLFIVYLVRRCRGHRTDAFAKVLWMRSSKSKVSSYELEDAGASLTLDQSRDQQNNA